MAKDLAVTPARPDLDPGLRALLAEMPLMSELNPEVLAQLRRYPSTPIDTLLDGRAVDRREITITTGSPGS
ncbi:hypothetical protein [Streptosporangium sp. V21-05]|uniref:hypothetical protein n=1 Tax=Streptosporangium sp. V21-05 TaxID=3446115 RepID=UPI003F529FE0